MRSRTLFFTIATIVILAVIAGAAYLVKNIIAGFDRTPSTQERATIRINRTVQGEVTETLASANIIVVKDASGQELNVAIVPETRITDEKDLPAEMSTIKQGFSVEAKGESVATNALIASDIRITATPEIMVFAPTVNDAVTSPLTVEGMAKGNWYFEANLRLEVVDAERRSLGKKYATATTDWMSESLVPFKGEVEFQKPTTKTGYLIVKNDNPSGLEEHEKTFEVPITFEPTTLTVKAFFNNSKLDPAFLCSKVFPVTRTIEWTQGTGRAAIEELLKGPSEQERALNYFTNIGPNVRINDIAIDNGTARIDFSEELDKNIGGSCRVTAIRAQITETLRQFPSVQRVEISINGRTDDILQP